MKKFNLHLYLVTAEASKCRYSLLETVRKAAAGGVTMVQYLSLIHISMCIRDRPSSGSKVRPLRGDCEPVGVRSQGRSLLVGKKL